MRVLFWMNSGEANIAGGHLVQFEQTIKHLKLLGIETAYVTSRPSSVSEFDIVHGYNISSFDVRFCKQQGVPVVLSTIYRSIRYHYPKATALESVIANIAGRLRISGALAVHSLFGNHEEKCRNLIENQIHRIAAYESADMLLPNAHGEAFLISSELGVSTPQRVIVNGVDEKIFSLNADSESESQRSYVLYCARFEPHKNQLGLIKAFRELNVPLVLVGAQHPDHLDYYRKCQRRAQSNQRITILPAVEHAELVLLYRGAKVHAIPSFFESTGLVSLEAALSGCNIVSGDRGYVKEYFADDVWYCDPYDVQSIAKAVTAAYEAPVSCQFRKKILERFTWHLAASQTLAAYESVLRKAPQLQSYDPELAALTRI